VPPRAFLLSPARSDGKRAAMLLRRGAAFDLARRLRSREGAAVGEVFSFASGLYFRGKLTYARAFAERSSGACEAYVIVPGRGLMRPDERVRAGDLRAFGGVAVDAAEAAFAGPLDAAARALAAGLGPRDVVVLLGSIASGKYVDVLLPVLGTRLCFPKDFVGRGDMSRGGLLLRCAREARELDYVPVAGTERRGPRPARLGAVAAVAARGRRPAP
jgi:hypothetical protein